MCKQNVKQHPRTTIFLTPIKLHFCMVYHRKCKLITTVECIKAIKATSETESGFISSKQNARP